ncbi:MAG TPA: hypothetical protein DCX03_11105 [Bacteroidales bacterium]|nr:hypothetical protein [Bacteroidales bacterium]
MAIIAFLIYFPHKFEQIGEIFKTNNELWKFLLSIPLVICSFSIGYAWKILNPISNGSNRMLHEWPHYWKLKYRVLISISICFLCVVGSLVIWVFGSVLSNSTIGYTFIGSCVISVTAAINQLLAAFRVRELMEP